MTKRVAWLRRPPARGLLGGATAFLPAFALAAAGVGLARAITTTYLPVLLDRIAHAPGLIGTVMLVNAVAGFAVPLAVGVWSDRSRDGRLGRRLPFLVAGTVFSAGGLVAIALGTASSYVVLGAAAAIVYVGLNASTTAHRTIVAESFGDSRRPAATGAQEIAMLVGALAGILAGGALAAASAAALFVAAAVALPLLAVPTVAVAGRLRPRVGSPERDHPRARPRDLAAVMRRAGPRRVLVAQVLWVTGYAALPSFMVLYAGSVLGLGVGAASMLVAGFAVLTGIGLLVAARQPPERVLPMLVAGAVLLGAGLVAAAPASSMAAAALPFAAAAVGAGLVTALGFPYFARFIPHGESGRYSGLYFASRAIASAVALPVAGFTVAATGSYRALLLQGAVALLAVVPLVRAERGLRGVTARDAVRPRPARVAAVIPCVSADHLRTVVEGASRRVDEVVIVDDGAAPEASRLIEPLGNLAGVRVLRLAANGGKGDAVQAGVAEVLARGMAPDAVLVLDADGQHPSDRIPDFVAAAERADVVIGDRSGDLAAMPWSRRFTNAVSSRLLGLLLGRALPDSQCGMRLYRTEALRACPLPPGRYEAETLHLRALAGHGLALAWISIPAIYGPEARSAFRPLVDTARVLLAIFGRRPPPPLGLRRPARGFARFWARRLGVVVGATILVAALLPLLGPLDNRLFLAIHSIGEGPEWVYRTFDPHMRNYFILGGLIVLVLAAARARVRVLVGVAVTLLFAAYFSNALVQLFYAVFDRPRPEEVLNGLFLNSHGRSWSHIESFPSGHMVITTAVAAAGASMVPALRGALALYIAVVALTRITFGAHFPLDVVVGTVFGYEVGRFSTALGFATGLLTTRPADVLPRLGRPGIRPKAAGEASVEP